jgi:hypothetical protein
MIGFGWAVIPLHGVRYDKKGLPHCSCRSDNTCKSKAKHPTTPQGLKNASIDQQFIDAWWRKWPYANVGVTTGATSGIVVLDVDPKNGGEDSLDDLLGKHGKLPDTAEVLTGGGGRHLYFKHPEGELRNSAGAVGVGLDIRGDGGYVVGPGSVHISGRAYDWEASSDPEQAGVAHMPAWLVDLCRAKGRGNGNGLAGSPVNGVVVEGGRNAWLTAQAGGLRRRGAGEKAIYGALSCLNVEHCVPILPDDEVRTIAHSVSRYPPHVMVRSDTNESSSR